LLLVALVVEGLDVEVLPDVVLFSRLMVEEGVVLVRALLLMRALLLEEVVVVVVVL